MATTVVNRQIRRKKKRRVKRLIRLSILIALVAAVAFTAYRGGVWAYQTFTGKVVKVQEFQETNFTATIKVDGVVVRDETMVMATESGQANFLVEDGTKVKAQAPVVEIQDPNSQQQLQAKLAEIDKRLTEFGNDTRESVTALDQQLLGIESSLNEKTRLLREEMAKTQPQGLAEKEKEIRDLNTKRLEILGKRGTVDGDRNSLLAQKAELQRQVSSTTVQFKAPSAGIVSYTLDGWETLLKTSDLASIGKDAFSAGPTPQQLNQVKDVKAGKALFKIVADTNWYWVAIIDKAQWNNLKSNTVSLRLPGSDKLLTGTLRNEQPYGESQVMVAFALSPVIPEAIAARHLSLELVRRQAQGMVVPEKVVKERQGTMGVYVLEQGIVHFKPVSIVDRQDGQVLVKGITDKVTVVTTPNWVRDGQKLKLR